MIPGVAVEAAAKFIYEDGWGGPPFWASLSDDHPGKLQALATSRASLEAAAPFMRPDFRESNLKAIAEQIANPLVLRRREAEHGDD